MIKNLFVCHTVFKKSDSAIKIYFLHGYLCNLLYCFWN